MQIGSASSVASMYKAQSATAAQSPKTVAPVQHAASPAQSEKVGVNNPTKGAKIGGTINTYA